MQFDTIWLYSVLNFRQITHLFLPYSQNTIINSECKRLFCRVEGGDAHWRLNRLPVVTRGAEPQEGDGFTRAWIESEGIPRYTNAQ